MVLVAGKIYFLKIKVLFLKYVYNLNDNSKIALIKIMKLKYETWALKYKFKTQTIYRIFKLGIENLRVFTRPI